MPMLNPGIIVDSPFLSDEFQVIRKAETVGVNGRSTTSAKQFCAHGVVTQAGRGDLERLDDAQRAEYVISVISQTQLRGPTPGAQPDHIKWAGTEFLVIKCLPYPRYGQGWYKILAASQTAIDPMPI